MTNNDTDISLEKVQKTVQNCIDNSELFLSVQEDLCEELKNTTKILYDLAYKNKFERHSTTDVLPELIIKDFDIEQIWQQIELENKEVFSNASVATFAKVLAETPNFDKVFEFLENPDSFNAEQLNNESEHKDEDQDEENIPEEPMSEDSEESDNDSTDKNDQVKTTKTSNNIKKRKRTEVDDKFFKLHQLDEYLTKEDKKEMNRDNDKMSSDEESIDLFNDFSGSDIDDNEDDEDDEDNGRRIKYADFFDHPESEDDDQNENNDNSKQSADEGQEEYKRQIAELQKERLKKKVRIIAPEDEVNQSENNENDKPCLEKLKEKDTPLENQENESENNVENKSTLEKRQDRLKKRITELEEEAISEKPWQLMGEATATSRPQNSLLEEYVDFDSATKPAPIMTEQTTMKLEDIILNRIKDRAWDDVEQKFKPVNTPREYKKQLIMNQEKSKESLAQIYENEYVKQRDALNSDSKAEEQKEEPAEHIEIKQRLHDLFTKLDALSNFHYTPKLAKPEIKIISNIPAISMEEVAPIAATNATQLAPEEVHSKHKHKGELIGQSERTKTDMKRARRKKKIKQRVRAMNEKKKLEENPKLQKSKTAKLGKLKGRNIINTDEDSNKMVDKSIKSSTAFFTNLQDQVQNTIKQKTNKENKKKKKTELTAVKLKL